MLIQPKKNRNKKGLALISSPTSTTSNSNSTIEGSILISNPSNNSSPNSLGLTTLNNNDSLPTSANLSEYNSNSTTSSSNNAGTTSSSSRSEYHQTLSRQLRSLELSTSSSSTTSSSHSSSSSSSINDPLSPSSINITGQGIKLLINNDKDLLILGELGSGNGGTVVRCQHLSTGIILAKKVSSFVILFFFFCVRF